MSDSRTIYVVDHDPDFVKKFSTIAQKGRFKAVPCVSSEEFFKRYKGAKPGCVLLRLQLADTRALDILERLRAQDSDVPVIALVGRGDPRCDRVVELGAVKFLESTMRPRSLLARLRIALAQSVRRLDLRAKREEARKLLARLTQREREILWHIVSGRINKEIAAQLRIAERTVENLRFRLIRKMQARTTADLVRRTLLADEHFAQT